MLTRPNLLVPLAHTREVAQRLQLLCMHCHCLSVSLYLSAHCTIGSMSGTQC